MPYVPPGYSAPTYTPPQLQGGGGTGAADPGFIELDLVGYLRDGLGLVAYPGHIPETAPLPALSFFLVYGASEYCLSGPTGNAETHVQLTVSSTDYLDCGRIAERLRAGLLRLKRRFMGSTWVSSVQVQDRTSGYEAAADRSDAGIHSKIIECFFFHRESIPK